MSTVLVKEVENKVFEEIESFREENKVLKILLKEYVKKSIDYEKLLKESMNLLDKYQEELEILRVGKNRWTDEVVKHYFRIKDLQKSLDSIGKEIMIYELNKNNKKCKKIYKV
ncbi:hypothetical protein LAV60_07215 [Clostridium sporogenes]|uniref:Uncharacterized protein n=2 Tax=Clostridium TaxID=1485 RepID=A0A0D1C180_CLOBO|nr:MULTISPECIES: hypothetical protein [Clostridium]MBE6078729.1 hypothetical protein [Clostridium lundense]MDU2832735.1 hypothetical protein [Clostridium botulinum]KIS24826.1 hypothetical protein N495_15020 [Clostridium botulinum B2 450]MCW6092963.1 hypothetical protein [Clostridium sporogenes]MCW7998810.1 hypothetical protein [Clostridium sp. cpc1]